MTDIDGLIAELERPKVAHYQVSDPGEEYETVSRETPPPEIQLRAAAALRALVAERDKAHKSIDRTMRTLCRMLNIPEEPTEGGWPHILDAIADQRAVHQERDSLRAQLSQQSEENERLRKTLVLIRDSTYRNAVTLRGIADAALAQGEKG